MSAVGTTHPGPGAGLRWERLSTIQEAANVGRLFRVLVTGSREGMISAGVGARSSTLEPWPQVFGLATREDARREGAKLAARLVLDALHELGGEAAAAALLDVAGMSDLELRQLRNTLDEEQRRRRAARQAAHDRAPLARSQEVPHDR